MIERFLKAKRWQLFLLLVGLPFVFYLIIMGPVLFNLDAEKYPEPAIMTDYYAIFPTLMIIISCLLFCWIWSIAIGLQKKIPQHLKMKVKKFKIFFFIPVIYMLLLALFIGISFGLPYKAGNESDSIIFGGMVLIFVLLHLVSMFCIFYTIYFAAKTLKTVELKREVRFGDFAVEFFLFWFYFIGIWILQPKINKMAVTEENTFN